MNTPHTHTYIQASFDLKMAENVPTDNFKTEHHK